MWLAKMLVAAARKELNNAPIKLKLEYPAIAEVQAIVPKIADAFRTAGVEIETVEVLPSRLGARAPVRAGGSTWPIASCGARSRCSMPA